MVTVAVLRVRWPSGALHTLDASHCEERGGRVHAIGRWRRPGGRHSDEGTYSWSRGRVVAIHYYDRVAA